MVGLIILGIILLAVALLFTISILIGYSGLFHSIDIKAGKPPVQNIVIAYKFQKGSYKNAGDLFTETVKLAPDQRCLAIYYDQPCEVADGELRYVVGCILAEGDKKQSKEMEEKMKSNNFKITTLPQIDHAVSTTFPFLSVFSIYIALYRVYPALADFIKEKKLCAYPFLEMYHKDVIQFWAPLAKQDEFYVPESKTTSSLFSEEPYDLPTDQVDILPSKDDDTVGEEPVTSQSKQSLDAADDDDGTGGDDVTGEREEEKDESGVSSSGSESSFEELTMSNS
ncbi:testis-expressed protein 264-like [Glandiceps talaboti]